MTSPSKIVFDDGHCLPWARYVSDTRTVILLADTWHVVGRKDLVEAGPSWEDARRMKLYLDRLDEGQEFAHPWCRPGCSCCAGKQHIGWLS